MNDTQLTQTTMRQFKDIQIAVAGTGYVGLSISTLLSQHHKVTAVDIIPEKVEKINNRISPIQDEYIEKYFRGEFGDYEKTGTPSKLNLTATLDGAAAYKDADFVVIAAPTNYDPEKNYFDTHCIKDVIDLVLRVNPDAVMVIKSKARSSTSYSPRNSSARARPSTTTSILPES